MIVISEKPFHQMNFAEKEKACRKFDFYRRFVNGKWVQCEKSYKNAQPDLRRLKKNMKPPPFANATLKQLMRRN